MKWFTQLKQQVRSLTEDEKNARIVRGGVLFILFLALSLALFFALQQWHSPLNHETLTQVSSVTAVQDGMFSIGAAMLIAALFTGSIAAFGMGDPEHRPAWYYPLVAGGLGLALWALGYIFLGMWPVGRETVMLVDMHHQYAPLLSELRQMLLEGGDLQYNFHVGMGAAFVPTYAYYLTSPLNLLLVLFPERYLAQAILVITLIKMAAAAASFTALVQYLYQRRSATMVAMGLFYALTGYMIAYSWNIMWLDVVVLLPAVVLAMEHMLKTGKVVPYAALLGLALFCNYYIGFMMCIFLVLYMVVWLLRSRRTLKEWGVACLRFAGGSAWGGAMAAAILIPTALSLGRTSAAGGEMVSFDTNFPLFDLLGRFFYGVEPTIRSGNLPNVYCGVAAVLLLPIYLSHKKIPLRRRVGMGALLTLLLFSCTLSQWDLLWHGLHTPNDLPYRFSFLLGFVMLVMAGHVVAEWDGITPRQILASLLGSCGFLFLWEKLSALTPAADAIAVEKVSISSELLYANVVILVMYAAVLLVYAMRRIPRQAANRLLLTAVCVELVFSTTVGLADVNRSSYYTDNANYVYNYSHTVTDAALRRAEELAAADAAEEGVFLRMEYLGRDTCVDTALHHYNGLTTFASSNPYLTTTFMGELGYAINGVNSYLYKSYVAPCDSLLGLRYVVLSVNLSNHPQLTKVDTVTMTDPSTGEVHNRYIYKNETALSVAFAASEQVKEYDGAKYAPFDSQQRLYQSLSGLSDEIYYPMHIEVPDGNGTIGGSSFSKAEGHTDFLATVYEEGQYFAYVDCRAAESIRVQKLKPSEEGSPEAWTQTSEWSVTTYEPYIIDVGTLKPGQAVRVQIDSKSSCTGNIHLVRMDDAALRRHVDVLRQGNLLITEQSGNSLSGTVTAQEDQVLFFSLPYDKGWQVYVDGSPVETFPIADNSETVMDDEGNWVEVPADDGALLGAEIPAGTHTVTAVYRAPGLALGLMVSIAALLPLVAIPLGRWWLRRRGRTILLMAKNKPTTEENA